MSGSDLARVVSVYGEEYELSAAGVFVRAIVSGGLRYQASAPSDMPVTGDWVEAHKTGGSQALITRVLLRRNCISRQAPGRRHEEQPLAANVDLVFVICAPDRDFSVRRVERYLAMASSSGAAAAVVLSKVDLCADAAGRVGELRIVANGVPVLPLSCVTGEGVNDIRGLLTSGVTAVLLGSSGVGKSTLVNALLLRDRQETGAVSASTDRGRHITTRRDLVDLPGGGYIIDTPGLREIQLWVEPTRVDDAFTEIASFAAECRYRDCRHAGEPGCAVASALACGQIDFARFRSWRKLSSEAARHEILTDHVAARTAKQKLKAFHRAIRRYKNEVRGDY